MKRLALVLVLAAGCCWGQHDDIYSAAETWKSLQNVKAQLAKAERKPGRWRRLENKVRSIFGTCMVHVFRGGDGK